MKRRINITPMLTEKELKIINRALYILEARNYDIANNDSIFEDIPLTAKIYEQLKSEADNCVKLRSRLESLYREKQKKPNEAKKRKWK